MNIEQTVDLLKYIDPDNGETAAKILPDVFKNAPLGVACHMMACTYCGFEFILFHAIPLKPPTECQECGKKQAFIEYELR